MRGAHYVGSICALNLHSPDLLFGAIFNMHLSRFPFTSALSKPFRLRDCYAFYETTVKDVFQVVEITAELTGDIKTFQLNKIERNFRMRNFPY